MLTKLVIKRKTNKRINKNLIMEQVELRTQHEIERERKHRAIINDYLELANQHPGCAATRLMNKVAEMHGMTSMGVRRILERNNILSNN